MCWFYQLKHSSESDTKYNGKKLSYVICQCILVSADLQTHTGSWFQSGESLISIISLSWSNNSAKRSVLQIFDPACFFPQLLLINQDR